MRILIFSWRDPKHPMAGGAEQVVHEHCKGWIEKGHEIVLFSSYFKGAKREEVLDGVKIIRQGVQLLGVHLLGIKWYLFSDHPKFDLAIDQFHGIPFFTPLFFKGKKLALIQEVTKEVWLLNHLPFPLNFLIGAVGFLIEPFIFLFYKQVPFMTGSLSAKKELTKFGIKESQITVIPHGVIIKSPKKMSKKEKTKTIVFLGALAKDKGVEDAIYTFSLLEKQDKFNFWIVGKGAEEYKTSLIKLAKKLKLTSKIQFFGFVKDEKKFDLLSRAHVLINPSFREGWGLVNIEANAMGTPVVAYNSPGLVDSIKDGYSGLLCQKNSPENLCSNILKLVNNPRLYSELSKNAIVWSKKFSWKNSRALSLKLIEQITE